ncbi:DUF1801 domain-containing protein [Gillisia sp. CAL575]|uniref:DUF1801 domain-containing protein n=1 Tax=Gillisia sp. CAL575 TaxID=985255 RepID=UPI0003A2969A|nr:DUF1801 domain-containing protein [Gillisia sp. CAL575]
MANALNVDEFIETHPKWEVQLIKLKELLLSSGLSETIKWGSPVYIKEGKNLVGIAAFKDHYGLWFFQGALLKKITKLLLNAQEPKTQVMRQIRFDNNSTFDLESLKPYIAETLSLHNQEKVIKKAKTKTVLVPFELKEAFLKYKN